MSARHPCVSSGRRSSSQSSDAPSRRRRHPASRRLRLEALEDRHLLSIFPVDAGPAWYVDDDAPDDPGPNDPAIGDPSECGSPDHPFDTIQEAVDAAGEGHTIQVAAGTYQERLTWTAKSISLIGAGASVTIVDANRLGRCLTITGGVPTSARVEGFTFTRGLVSAGHGGGILVDASSPTLANNVITGNEALTGGGSESMPGPRLGAGAIAGAVFPGVVATDGCAGHRSPFGVRDKT